MKRKNTEEAEAETRKNAEAAAEELATDEHGMTRKNTEEGRRIIDSEPEAWATVDGDHRRKKAEELLIQTGSVSDGQLKKREKIYGYKLK